MERKTYERKLIEDEILLVKFVCVDHLGANFLSPVMSCSPSIAEGTGKTFTKEIHVPLLGRQWERKQFFLYLLIVFSSK